MFQFKHRTCGRISILILAPDFPPFVSGASIISRLHLMNFEARQLTLIKVATATNHMGPTSSARF